VSLGVFRKGKIKLSYPIDDIRGHFPALSRAYNGKPVAYLDGPGGSQSTQTSIDAIVKYMSNGAANLHGAFASSRETEAMIEGSKQSIADLLGAKPEEVAFGQNMTSLAFSIGRAMGKGWKAGDEIVVSELDHRANVDPWVRAAQDAGASVKWLEADPETLCLDLGNLNSIITSKTRLVAVGLASNAVGTVNDVRRISERARAVGALVVVDAVHATPHISIDRDALGADILLCSAYKFFGPHVGIAVIRAAVFEELSVYKLQPAPRNIPDKLETGTQNHEGIAGIAPAIEFFSELGTGVSRREKITSGLKLIESYENSLAAGIRDELGALRNVTLFSANSSVAKTPTIAFTVDDLTPREVCLRLAEEGLFAADGDFYATTLARKLGILESGGWVRVGLAHYNTESEASRFVDALKKL
jgi:cysteine desulfurase family protein (TIGR01976 family)